MLSENLEVLCAPRISTYIRLIKHLEDSFNGLAQDQHGLGCSIDAIDALLMSEHFQGYLALQLGNFKTHELH